MIRGKRRYGLLLLIAAIVVPAAAWGKSQRGGSRVVGGLRPPAFLEHVFRPEQIMRHQQAIGLTGEQREAITRAIHETQQRLLDLQWQLDARSEEATKLFAADRIEVDPALARAAAVMEVEGQIKQEHLRLLIRLKNELTPAQQEKLRELRPGRCKSERD